MSSKFSLAVALGFPWSPSSGLHNTSSHWESLTVTATIFEPSTLGNTETSRLDRSSEVPSGPSVCKVVKGRYSALEGGSVGLAERVIGVRYLQQHAFRCSASENYISSADEPISPDGEDVAFNGKLLCNLASLRGARCCRLTDRHPSRLELTSQLL